MDIEKLVEDGVQAFRAELWKIEIQLGRDVTQASVRAVGAVFLKAAAEEAADHAADDITYAIKYPDETQRMGERAHRARTISNRLRALAAQLGGSDA